MVSICDSLIGLHAFTGCDTVSAFASRGKLSALKLMKNDITCQETFSQVGQSWDVQPQIFEKVQQFTCPMYVAASRTTKVKDLRYQLFCAKRGEIESSLLPPCRYCLLMHLIRANYQAAIWKCCLPALPTVPNHTKCGCGRHQHQILSWNCWLASVSVPVSCQSVHAWQTD